MVRRLLERVIAPIRGLHQAAYVLAILTLASQALALLRDRTFAHAFGAGHTLDLYYAAFRVPDLVFALVSSLVSAYVLIPRITNGNHEENRLLLSESTSFLLIGGGLICLLLGIFAPHLLFFIYPGFADVPERASFILLARILLLQPIILGISGVVTSVTQVNRRFFLFALSPVLYNLGIIFGTVVLYPLYGLPGIGIGVLLGACAHVGVHIPVLVRAGVFPKLVIPRMRDLAPIIRDSVPRSLALGMGSITALALTALAVRIGTGSVSVFTLASNLEAVPLALTGASYAVAAFPALSEASAIEQRPEFTRILSASSKHIILWSLVFMGLIIVLRAHLVRVILGSGAFDWDATRLTAALLALFVVGLVAQGLVLLFSRALYAVRQSWRPFFYQLIAGVGTVVAAVVLLTLPADGFLKALAQLFRVGSVPGSTILLIAFASTLGQVFLFVLSAIALAKVAPGLLRSLMRPVLHGAAAALFAAIAAYAVLFVAGDIAPLTTLVSVFTQGLLAGMVGLVGGAVTLIVLKNEEFSDVVRAFTRFTGMRSILGPSAEEPAQP